MLGGCAVLVALTVVEIFLRLTMPIAIHKITSERYQTSMNPEIGYELKPLALDHNDAGLRDHAYAMEKPPETFRIILIGDSLAYGYGLRLEDTYAKKLENSLNQSHPGGVEVINFGVPGYSIGQVIARLREKGLAYQPDMIIYGYWLDDIFFSGDSEEASLDRFIENDASGRSRLVMANSTGLRGIKGLLLDFQVVRRLLAIYRAVQIQDRLIISRDIAPDFMQKQLGAEIGDRYYQYLNRVLDGTYKDIPGFEPYFLGYADQKNFTAWNRSLAEFSQICRGNNIQCLVLMTPVFSETAGQGYNWQPLHEFINEIVSQHSIPVLDTSRELLQYPADQVALPAESGAMTAAATDPEHLNDFGSEIVARSLFRHLSNLPGQQSPPGDNRARKIHSSQQDNFQGQNQAPGSPVSTDAACPVRQTTAT